MRRNGFTLAEMMIVIVIMGIMMAAALPKLHDWSLAADARSARSSARSLLAQARAAAVQSNRTTTVSFDGTRGLVTASPRLSGSGSVDTVGSVLSLSGQYHVTMSPSSWNVSYDPRGLGTNMSPIAVTFTRSGHAATFTVSPYGRVNQ